MSIENTEIGQNKTDYQGLVTNWREDAKQLSTTACQTKLDAAHSFGCTLMLQTCAAELAEVIARNVQPSPEQEETSIWPLSIVDEAEPDEPVAYLYRVREVGKQIVEFAAVDGWRPKDPAKEVIVDKWPLYLREARPVQQPATESRMREALSAAVPFLFEHGRHVHQHCYRGSYDGCYCGLDEAKNLMTAALALRDVPQGPDEQWIYSVGHGDDCECGLSVKSLHRTLEEAEIKAQKLLAEDAWHTDEHKWIEVPWNADDPNTLKLWKLGTTHDIVGIIRWPLAARQVPVGPEGKK